MQYTLRVIFAHNQSFYRPTVPARIFTKRRVTRLSHSGTQFWRQFRLDLCIPKIQICALSIRHEVVKFIRSTGGCQAVPRGIPRESHATGDVTINHEYISMHVKRLSIHILCSFLVAAALAGAAICRQGCIDLDLPFANSYFICAFESYLCCV